MEVLIFSVVYLFLGIFISGFASWLEGPRSILKREATLQTLAIFLWPVIIFELLIVGMGRFPSLMSNKICAFFEYLEKKGEKNGKRN